MRALAGETTSAVEDTTRLNAAARTAREETAELARTIGAELKAQLIALGFELLPTVNQALLGVIENIRTIRSILGLGSLFEGLDLTVPDDDRGLTRFLQTTGVAIEDAKGQLADLKAQLEEVEGKSTFLLGPVATLRKINAQDTLAAQIQFLTDEITQLEGAADTARAKLRDLRGLPDLIVTARRPPTEAERKRAAADAKRAADQAERDAERVDAATRDMVERLGEMEAALFGGRPKSLWQTIADDVAALQDVADQGA